MVEAIEFRAKVTDGRIALPEEHRERIKGVVRVIVLAEENAAAFDMIDYLLANPLSVEAFNPLTREEVYER